MIGDQQSRSGPTKRGPQKWLKSRKIGIGTRGKNIVTKTKNFQREYTIDIKTIKCQPAVSGEQ